MAFSRLNSDSQLKRTAQTLIIRSQTPVPIIDEFVCTLLDEHRPSKKFNFITAPLCVKLGRSCLITSRVVEKLKQWEFTITTVIANTTATATCTCVTRTLTRTTSRHCTRTGSIARWPCYSTNPLCFRFVCLRPILILITVIDIKGVTPSVRSSGCQFKFRSLIIANRVRTGASLTFVAIRNWPNAIEFKRSVGRRICFTASYQLDIMTASSRDCSKQCGQQEHNDRYNST